MPTSHAPEDIPMPSMVAPKATTMAGVHNAETSMLGFHGENAKAMLDIQAPAEVKSMPSYTMMTNGSLGESKIASSNDEFAALDSNLEILADVGLAGGSMDTPVAPRGTDEGFQTLKNSTMPLLSNLKLENTSPTSGNDVAMPHPCSSTPETVNGNNFA